MAANIWIKLETYSRNKRLLDLAAAVGIRCAHLSELINGTRPLSPEIEQKIQHIFQVWDEQKPAFSPLSGGAAGRIIRNMSRPIG